MNKNLKQKIYIAGHNGMVGSAIMRKLRASGYDSIITRDRTQLDLTNQQAVHDFFQTEQPDYVFLAAARVGGVLANNVFRAEFLYENLMIQTNIIHAAHQANVQRLLFLGSSCIYPRDCPQPILEEYLLSAPLEQTNEPYAIAKIAGIKLCENYNRQYNRQYMSVMPTNLFGQNDNYDLNTSHVLPALIRKVHEAKLNNAKHVVVWGSGNPLREFLFVDDMADACVFLMEHNIQETLLNIGTGTDIRICDLAAMVMRVIGFNGEIIFDASKPDGTPRKLLNINKMSKLGWNACTTLEDGIHQAYQDFLAHQSH